MEAASLYAFVAYSLASSTCLWWPIWRILRRRIVVPYGQYCTVCRTVGFSWWGYIYTYIYIICRTLALDGARNRAKPSEGCSLRWRGEGLKVIPQCGGGCRCRYSYCRRIQMMLAFRMLLSVISVTKRFEMQSIGIGSSRRVAGS